MAHAGGRPEKITPEVVARIVEFIRHGNYVETAALAAGITKQTLYNWLKKAGREKAGPYREFLDAIEKAMAEAEARDVLLISKAAQEQWQAAAWRLERKYPERWGRRDTLLILQKLAREVEALSDTDLLALLGYGDEGADPAAAPGARGEKTRALPEGEGS